jgi:hypothetical protein
MENNILEFMILEANDGVDTEVILILDNPNLAHLQDATISINFDGIRSTGLLTIPGGSDFTFGPLKGDTISHITSGRLPVMLMDTNTNIIKDVELMKIVAP